MRAPSSVVPRIIIVTSLMMAAVAAQESPDGPAPAAEERPAEFCGRPMWTWSQVQLAEWLHSRAGRDLSLPVALSVGDVSLRMLGQPFRLGAHRYDLAESDCVTFVERALALALASDWQCYCKLLERLRHKDGEIDFLDRNFFTLTQWVPNNAWLLVDVTVALGQGQHASFEHVVRPKAFYQRLEFGLDDTPEGKIKKMARDAKVQAVPEVESSIQHYLARETVLGAANQLSTGDILLVIRWFGSPDQKPWLDCDHLLVAVRGGDQLWLVGPSRMGVRSETLETFFRERPHVAGLKVLRLRDDASLQLIHELAKVPDSVVLGPEAVDAAMERHR